MKEEERHILDAVIRDFAYGRVQLQVHEFRHIQECDQCSHTWWTLKQEAKREKKCRCEGTVCLIEDANCGTNAH